MSKIYSELRNMTGLLRILLRSFGFRGLMFRAHHMFRMRFGVIKLRLPTHPDYTRFDPAPWKFHFNIADVESRYRVLGNLEQRVADAKSRADRITAGWQRPYSGDEQLVGWPPRWDSKVADSIKCFSEHWSDLSDDLGESDIKDIWELSRFAFTFPLARAYLLTHDNRYVEEWWRAFEDWCSKNPPNTGPNWRCAQEASIRALGVCFALSAFRDADSSTHERVRSALQFLEATRQRVRNTLSYALSQRNNHAISELVFLLTLDGDNRLYNRLLRWAISDQWYADGSYSQRSLNYQRLAVHKLCWLLHTQSDLPSATRVEVRYRLAQSAEFLTRSTDPLLGRIPNSGANDGSLLLAIDPTEFSDMRPTLAILGVPSQAGSSAEISAWFPPTVLTLPDLKPSSDSTYFSLRGSRSLLFTHLGPSRHRAGDNDQQAIELIWDGYPLVLDPGTYRYSAGHPWRQPFVDEVAHSTILPVVSFQRASYGRFLRQGMPVARVLSHSPGEAETLSSSRIDSGVTLTRTILRHSDCYEVTDHGVGGRWRARWLLRAPISISQVGSVLHLDYETVDVAIGGDRIRVIPRSTDDPLSGWWSPTYASLQPALVVEVEMDSDTSTTTHIMPR